MRRYKLVLVAGSLLALAILLAGCGHKGDLYLPDQQEQQDQEGTD